MIYPLLHQIGVTPKTVRDQVDQALDRIPKVYAQGQAADVRISPAAGAVLDQAGREAETLTDEYVSTEHLLLALLEVDSGASSILRDAGLTRDGVLSALAEVRGRQRVTDQNPEDKYNGCSAGSMPARRRGCLAVAAWPEVAADQRGETSTGTPVMNA